MRKPFVVLMAFSLLLLLAACGGNGATVEETAATGDPVRGEQLYMQTAIGSANAPGCITCHSLEPGVVLVGPSHDGVATRAESYVPGVAAEAFLRQSIVDPNAHVVEGFPAGVMYQNYAQDLAAPQIDDLVAFMLTLE
jgi:cytochrome c551/c552